jgi:nicotinate-nucleotide adenylyltransferase
VTSFGLLGGTFDPVHAGHLDLAQAARRAVGLERVVLVPSHVPPHRQTPHASAAHRFAMAALAVQDQPGLEVSDLELLEAGPSYTTRTLDRLAARGVDTRSVFFVTGADAFREIESWADYPAILERCHFVVVSRPGSPAGAIRTALPALAARMQDAPCPPASRPGIFLVEAATSDVSSTEVRRRVASGESIAGLVPDAVAGHIARHRLYRDPTGSTSQDQGVS